MIWVTTDSHFGHAKVMAEVGRPPDYEARISKAWRRIPASDVLIHLGDVCFGNDAQHHAEHVEPLRFKKWLVLGNHDNKSVNWYLSHGWDWCGVEMRMRMYGKDLIFHHEPRYPWDLEGHHLCGHLHLHRDSNGFEHPCQRIIRLEVDGYQPISLKRLVA